MRCPADFSGSDQVFTVLAIRMAADHASRAHRGQFRNDRGIPYIIHPARVASLVAFFSCSHLAVIAAWLHDVYEDCPPEWIGMTDKLISGLPLPADERGEIAAMVAALTKKNSLAGRADRLSDSLRRIVSAPPETTLVKLCDRIDNLIDAADRGAGFLKRYRASTDEVIAVLSGPAREHGFDAALDVLVRIRNTDLKSG